MISDFQIKFLYTQAVAYNSYFELMEPMLEAIIKRKLLKEKLSIVKKIKELNKVNTQKSSSNLLIYNIT